MPARAHSDENSSSFEDSWTPSTLRSEILEYVEEVYEDFSSVLAPLDLENLDFTVSRRLYRAGGYCETKFDDTTRHEITISYPAYCHWGWNRIRGIVRHELAHAAVFTNYGPDVSPHGPEFQSLAERLDAPIKGEESLPYRFELRCSVCGGFVDGLYESSQRTKRPSCYRSDCCDAPLDVDERFPSVV